MITLIAIVTMLTLTTSYVCFAATTVPIAVIATVEPLTNGLSAKTYMLNTKGTCDTPGSTDDWNGYSIVMSMNFGNLSYDATYGIFATKTYFAVDVPVLDNSGNIWTITHTRSNFQNFAGTANLNNKVNVVFKRVKLKDGATTNTDTEEEQLDKVSYTNSNNASYTKNSLKFANGKQGWLRVYYGIATGDPGNGPDPNDPSKTLPGCIADATGTSPIGMDTPAGTYTGSVTLTLTGV